MRGVNRISVIGNSSDLIGWQLPNSESTICFYETEVVMALLKSLKLSPYNPTSRNNSFTKRRRKLIAKIDEQILLATDSNYKPMKIKWLHDEALKVNLKYQSEWDVGGLRIKVVPFYLLFVMEINL